MNTRHIAHHQGWFGGGADLTPMDPDDERHARPSTPRCRPPATRTTPDCYARFKKWCDEYFFLPHRNEPRGVGGIFYDYLEERLRARLRLHPRRRRGLPRRLPAARAPAHERALDARPSAQHQLVRRGRYVEFNLLYDRGTLFGLKTGGNVEAILMSLPPEVALALIPTPSHRGASRHGYQPCCRPARTRPTRSTC